MKNSFKNIKNLNLEFIFETLNLKEEFNSLINNFYNKNYYT